MDKRTSTLKTAAKRLGITVLEYLYLKNAGMKHCSKGKHWTKISNFGIDTSRGDGHKANCKECDYHRKQHRPSKLEFSLKRSQGLKWCQRCGTWLAQNEVRSGACRKHLREIERERYATQPVHRFKIQQRVKSRKRKIAPMTPLAAAYRIEWFDGECAYCNNPATTWDHVVPVSQGGDTTPDNILPACVSCNSSKNDANVYEWIERKGIIPKYRLAEALCFMGIMPEEF